MTFLFKVLTVYAIGGLVKQALSDEPYWLAVISYTSMALSGAIMVHNRYEASKDDR